MNGLFLSIFGSILNLLIFKYSLVKGILLQNGKQLLGIQRLGFKSIHAGSQSLPNKVLLDVPRNANNGRLVHAVQPQMLLVELPELLRELNAVHFGHLDVRDYKAVVYALAHRPLDGGNGLGPRHAHIEFLVDINTNCLHYDLHAREAELLVIN